MHELDIISSAMNSPILQNIGWIGDKVPVLPNPQLSIFVNIYFFCWLCFLTVTVITYIQCTGPFFLLLWLTTMLSDNAVPGIRMPTSDHITIGGQLQYPHCWISEWRCIPKCVSHDGKCKHQWRHTISFFSKRIVLSRQYIVLPIATMRVRIIDLQSSQISKIERRYTAREMDEYEFSENRKMAITTTV